MVREIVHLSSGGTFLSIYCSLLEIWWLKLKLKLCSEIGDPVLRPPELVCPAKMGGGGGLVYPTRPSSMFVLAREEGVAKVMLDLISVDQSDSTIQILGSNFCICVMKVR